MGETRKQAMQLIEEAVELHIESLRDQDEPVPGPSSESEFIETSAA